MLSLGKGNHAMKSPATRIFSSLDISRYVMLIYRRLGRCELDNLRISPCEKKVLATSFQLIKSRDV
jgi:hypothetical protein